MYDQVCNISYNIPLVNESINYSRQRHNRNLRPKCIKTVTLTKNNRPIDNQISLFYQNVRGLRTKTTELLSSITNNDYDIIVLVETWLTPNIFDCELVDSRYVVFRYDRNPELSNKKLGGGVLIAVKNNLKTNQLNTSQIDSQIEMVGVSVRFSKNYWFYLYAVYFECNSPIEKYQNFFQTIACFDNNILSTRSQVMIVGDFNLKDFAIPLNLSDIKLLALNNFMSTYKLNSCNNIKNVNLRTLDLVLANCSNVQVNNETPLVPLDSHHPALHILFTVGFIKSRTNSYQPDVRSVETRKPAYNFAKANFESLYKDLSEYNWGKLYENKCVNVSVSQFYCILYELLDKHVPKRSTKPSKFPPWYNKQLISLHKVKRKLEKKRYRCHENNQKFLTARAEFHKQAHELYVEYLQGIGNNITSDPKTFFNYIKNKHKNSASSIYTLDGKDLADDKTAADALANFFLTSYSSDKSNYNITDIVTNSDSNYNSHYFHLDKVSSADLKLCLTKLKSNHSIGPDEIPGYLVKGLFEVLQNPLVFLFNLSLSTCVFPDKWKEAIVVAIPKKGNTTDISQQRPISLLNNFSKLFDILLHLKLSKHFSLQLSPFQHGFVPRRSTVTNLLGFTQFVSDSLDKQGQVDCIYTDFEKAFDRVNHDILLRKLYLSGLSIQLVAFFCSYLSSRSMRVKLRNEFSSPYISTSGVPQGGVCAPLLFLIMINNLPDVLKYSKCYLFADDFKLFRVIRNTSDCYLLQCDLEAIVKWSLENKLTFSVAKCRSMTYCRKKTVTPFNYVMSGQVLDCISEYKDLGIVFNRQLTFTDHISHLTSTCHKNFGFIKRNSKYFNHNTVTSLFNLLVRSKLEYASVVWSPRETKYIKLLEQVERKYLRYLHYKQFNIYPIFSVRTSALCELLQHNRLSKRRQFAQMWFLYKIMSGAVDDVDLLFQVGLHVPDLRTRHNNNLTFHVPVSRTVVHDGSPVHQMLCCGNLLSKDLDLAMTPGEFRRKLHSLLLQFGQA